MDFPDGVPDTGHAAVAIPGTVAGLTTALQKYGTMPLSRVLAPAIRLAEQGFVVSPTLAGIVIDNFDAIRKNEPLARVLCPGGLPIEAGDTLKNPDLAASLRKIAEGGADVFYKGAIAEAIASEMTAHGGRISKADLASYRAIEREPVRGRYRGYDIVSAPPPVGGIALIEILQILGAFDLSKETPLSPRYVHLAAEAMKRGFADYAAAVGDPEFVKVPVAGLLSADYARSRAAEIHPDRMTAKVAAGAAAKQESPSTTSLSVVDAHGNMVALTQTISDFFGAKVIVAGHRDHPQQRDEELRIARAQRHRARQADADDDRANHSPEGREDVRRARHARRGPHRLDDDAARVEPGGLRHGHPGGHRGPAVLRARYRGRPVDRGEDAGPARRTR